MINEPDNFDQLRKLLALKRYEQPPPTFFYQFTRDVMRRISTGAHATESVGDRTWIERLWQYLEIRPWLAGAVGAVACAALIAWIIYAQHVEWAPPTLPVVTQHVPEPSTEAPALVQSDKPATPMLATSTNPVPPGLFDPFGLRIERVNLSISNR